MGWPHASLLCRPLVIVALLVVAACSGPPQAIIGLDGENVSAFDVPGATKVDVFVVTTRALSEDRRLLFSGEREDDVSFARITVSIPPNHEPGKIERPTSGTPDPREEFVLLDPTIFPNGNAFVAGVDRSLARKPANEHDVLVFIHGYNTDFTSAVLRIAQFAHDINYPGVPVLFTWASAGKTFDYVYDINSVLHARDALLDTGNLLSRTKADGFNVIAHSMGTLLTMEAMRQAALTRRQRDLRNFRVRSVALAAPDIDLDLFRRQLDVVLTGDVPIYVLTSTDDRALAISRRIAGGRNRAGATDPEQLAELGVTVIDLSDIEDTETISHTKFANSPEVIQVLALGLREGNDLQTGIDDSVDLSRIPGVVGNLFADGRVLQLEAVEQP